MFTSLKRKFFDFNARVCAVRETFEEINILIARPIDGVYTENYSGLRDEYLTKYNSNFLHFCKDKRIIPDLN